MQMILLLEINFFGFKFRHKMIMYLKLISKEKISKHSDKCCLVNLRANKYNRLKLCLMFSDKNFCKFVIQKTALPFFWPNLGGARRMVESNFEHSILHSVLYFFGCAYRILNRYSFATKDYTAPQSRNDPLQPCKTILLCPRSKMSVRSGFLITLQHFTTVVLVVARNVAQA